MDDLADETISTLDLLVNPPGQTSTKLNIHTPIDLSERDLLGTDYTLDGELQLVFES